VGGLPSLTNPLLYILGCPVLRIILEVKRAGCCKAAEFFRASSPAALGGTGAGAATPARSRSHSAPPRSLAAPPPRPAPARYCHLGHPDLRRLLLGRPSLDPHENAGSARPRSSSLSSSSAPPCSPCAARLRPPTPAPKLPTGLSRPPLAPPLFLHHHL
jgi:hypothetical protein